MDSPGRLLPSLISIALFLTSAVALAGETITLQADADTKVRTDLDIRRNDNYGCDPFLQIGTSRGGGSIPFGGPDAIRNLIHFDLSGIPVSPLSTAVLEVTVWGFANGTGASVFTVDTHRVIDSGPLTPWIEGNGSEAEPLPPGCDGTDPAFGVAWVGAGDGGDANNQTQPAFDPAVEASALIRQVVNQKGDVIQWDITSLVRRWLDGTDPNFGLLLRDGTSDGTFRELFLVANEQSLFPAFPLPLNSPRLVLTFASVFHCVGFEPLLNSGPVTVKKNRALPFKAQLFDENGIAITNTGLTAPPVIQVLFTPVTGGDPIDVSADALPAGQGTAGNQFVFTSDNKWQFNLKLVRRETRRNLNERPTPNP